jgi:putative membrane protein
MNILSMRLSRLFIVLPAFALFHSQARAQGNTKLTDPEIAAIAVAANQVDIKAAELAETKSKNADVRDFAKTMINDHQSVIDKATALVKKLHVTPKSNAISRQLVSQGEKNRIALRAKSGAAFDKAYIDNEVTYHQAVINVVNNQLIPQAENSELKQLLQSVAPVLQTHLEHAQMVQRKLSGK